MYLTRAFRAIPRLMQRVNCSSTSAAPTPTARLCPSSCFLARRQLSGSSSSSSNSASDSLVAATVRDGRASRLLNIVRRHSLPDIQGIHRLALCGPWRAQPFMSGLKVAVEHVSRCTFLGGGRNSEKDLHEAALLKRQEEEEEEGDLDSDDDEVENDGRTQPQHNQDETTMIVAEEEENIVDPRNLEHAWLVELAGTGFNVLSAGLAELLVQSTSDGAADPIVAAASISLNRAKVQYAEQTLLDRLPTSGDGSEEDCWSSASSSALGASGTLLQLASLQVQALLNQTKRSNFDVLFIDDVHQFSESSSMDHLADVIQTLADQQLAHSFVAGVGSAEDVRRVVDLPEYQKLLELGLVGFRMRSNIANSLVWQEASAAQSLLQGHDLLLFVDQTLQGPVLLEDGESCQLELRGDGSHSSSAAFGDKIAKEFAEAVNLGVQMEGAFIKIKDREGITSLPDVNLHSQLLHDLPFLQQSSANWRAWAADRLWPTVAQLLENTLEIDALRQWSFHYQTAVGRTAAVMTLAVDHAALPVVDHLCKVLDEQAPDLKSARLLETKALGVTLAHSFDFVCCTDASAIRGVETLDVANVDPDAVVAAIQDSASVWQPLLRESGRSVLEQ